MPLAPNHPVQKKELSLDLYWFFILPDAQLYGWCFCFKSAKITCVSWHILYIVSVYRVILVSKLNVEGERKPCNMESGSSCLCESSEPTDPTEYLEILKKKYLDRTAKLQAQQLELERKILKMETFIGGSVNFLKSGVNWKLKFPGKPQGASQPGLPTCQCDSLAIPKVFPEAPVRDVPTVPKALTDVIQNQQPVTQQCSFFQKMMENAKSILSMKCQCSTIGTKTTG